ncbi:MAG: ATP-grasp domain-containing protein [Acidobacteriota bacterium]|nr:ATP-grasp domain-containing protein [Acidobacteriota bacterium]MDH3786245.1 ATP-grasp domain-containing protein [Acidobacteriota bacterium]
MHVVFVEPAFPSNQREFVRGLHKVGARVTGIGERPAEYLDDEMKSWLTDYIQVPSVVHQESLLDAVRTCQKKGWVDRLEATVEAHIMPTAEVREACGIPGTSVRTAFLCRDKPAMKEALREAGVACAQSDGVQSAEAAIEFAERVGYPVILKPRAAAGASGTYKASDREELDRVIVECGLDRGQDTAIEEFIEGHEGFYDTLCHEGQIVHEFATHYYPNVLEAMRSRWISPQFIATNRLDADGYEMAREMGRKVIDVLGLTTSATHMEWFYSAKGLKFSEIGCRPAGVCAWDIYCAANDFDLYAEWARAVTGQPSRERPSRQYSAGTIALRPDRDGTIMGYEGRDWIENTFGRHIFASHFPAPGTPTQPVEAGYMANAWIRMRHPDYDTLHAMLNEVGERVRIRASD